MATLAPLFIFFGVAGAVAIGCVAFWDRLVTWISGQLEPYRKMLARAAIRVKAEELAFVVLGFAVFPWGIAVAFLKPSPALGVLILACTSVFSFYGTQAWIRRRVRKRLTMFDDQLETALRLISGALRVGLGLRQAVVSVVQDMPDPARIEFSRVLTQTQIGVSIYDALDQLAERMPSSEMLMMTRAVRVQSQSGGNLTRVLDNLADTIKQRRRIRRKIKALTAEAVTSKYIICALPLAVGGIVMILEPDMREALTQTVPGWICLGTVLGLLAIGWWSFGMLIDVDI